MDPIENVLPSKTVRNDPLIVAAKDTIKNLLSLGIFRCHVASRTWERTSWPAAVFLKRTSSSRQSI